MKIHINKVMLLAFIFSILLINAKYLYAQDNHFGTHVHGLSELMIAIDGQTLEIHLESPAFNLTAFEYKAVTEQELAIVKKVAFQLEKHDELFSFSGGSCTLITKEIDIPSLNTKSKHKHDHSKNAYNAQHSQNTKHNKLDSHTEINASYRYHCDNASELLSITVELFGLFQGIQQIHTQWITEKRQGAVILNADKNIIHLR